MAVATINDFKIVNQYSKKYFNFLDVENGINENEQKRLGFYILALECITGNANVDELVDCIIDTEFTSLIKNERNNDYGIDAVYVDEDKRLIQLFNFKFRENYRQQRGQNERNILDSSKFMMKLQTGKFDDVDRITKEKMELINEKFESDEIWSTVLYLVSNDNIGLESDNDTKNVFKDAYDISVNSISLDEIISYISNRPDDIGASFIVSKESVLTYEENSLSSSKSYLVRLPVSTIIRLTCKDRELRNNPSLDDLSELSEVELDLGVLYDNVRGYLGETRFNKNILNTLEKEPSKFFMYNNGITITAKDIIMRQINGQTKYQCNLSGFQIVNGGQTVRTIYEFKNNNFDEEKIVTAEVLVRIFKTEEDQELTNNIAEYTNSQNAISSVDLKSISNLQIQIDRYLSTENILYVRKAGDFESENKEFDYRITMERLAQIIYSYKGFPDRATNQKSQLFDRYYDDIFNANDLDLDIFVRLIRYYHKIEKLYDDLDYHAYTQKYLYVVFLKSKLKNKDDKHLIELVENALENYKANENLPDARKLIQRGFRLHLETLIDKE